MTAVHSEDPCTQVTPTATYEGAWSLDWACGGAADGEGATVYDCDPSTFPDVGNVMTIGAAGADGRGQVKAGVIDITAGISDTVVYISTSQADDLAGLAVQTCAEGYARVGTGWRLPRPNGTSWYARADRM